MGNVTSIHPQTGHSPEYSLMSSNTPRMTLAHAKIFYFHFEGEHMSSTQHEKQWNRLLAVRFEEISNNIDTFPIDQLHCLKSIQTSICTLSVHLILTLLLVVL